MEEDQLVAIKNLYFNFDYVIVQREPIQELKDYILSKKKDIDAAREKWMNQNEIYYLHSFVSRWEKRYFLLC